MSIPEGEMRHGRVRTRAGSDPPWPASSTGPAWSDFRRNPLHPQCLLFGIFHPLTPQTHSLAVSPHFLYLGLGLSLVLSWGLFSPDDNSCWIQSAFTTLTTVQLRFSWTSVNRRVRDDSQHPDDTDPVLKRFGNCRLIWAASPRCEAGMRNPADQKRVRVSPSRLGYLWTFIAEGGRGKTHPKSKSLSFQLGLKQRDFFFNLISWELGAKVVSGDFKGNDDKNKKD